MRTELQEPFFAALLQEAGVLQKHGLLQEATTACQGYPNWWPFHVEALITSPTQPAKVMRELISDLWNGLGFNRSQAHPSMPALPPEGGPVANDDIRTSVQCAVTVVHDFVTSLCVAHAFFHPQFWHMLRDNDLGGILCLDELPLVSTVL